MISELILKKRDEIRLGIARLLIVMPIVDNVDYSDRAATEALVRFLFEIEIEIEIKIEIMRQRLGAARGVFGLSVS